MPLHKTPKPTCALPDERHITGPRNALAIVDKDRASHAGHLDVYQVVEVDEHDVGSRCATASTGDGRAGRPFQADPSDYAAGTYQTHLTYS